MYTVVATLGVIVNIVALASIPILLVCLVIMCIKLLWDRFH